MSQASGRHGADTPSAEPVTVTVRILDRDYQVSCPPDERDALERAARHLDERMRGIRNSGKIVGVERIAVMAALNLTHEYLMRDDEVQRLRADTQREIDRLDRRLGEALAAFDRTPGNEADDG
jgi:cell division protein ZapA